MHNWLVKWEYSSSKMSRRKRSIWLKKPVSVATVNAQTGDQGCIQRLVYRAAQSAGTFRWASLASKYMIFALPSSSSYCAFWARFFSISMDSIEVLSTPATLQLHVIHLPIFYGALLKRTACAGSPKAHDQSRRTASTNGPYGFFHNLSWSCSNRHLLIL